MGEPGDELMLLHHLALQQLDLHLLGAPLLLCTDEGYLKVLDVLLELLCFGAQHLGGSGHVGIGVLPVHQTCRSQPSKILIQNPKHQPDSHGCS